MLTTENPDFAQIGRELAFAGGLAFAILKLDPNQRASAAAGLAPGNLGAKVAVEFADALTQARALVYLLESVEGDWLNCLTAPSV
jgi:hypothetical protein